MIRHMNTASHPRRARLTATLVLGVCACLLNPFSAIAEEGIVTDRPDVAESSAVVGRGHFQIETSFVSERDKADGLKTTRQSTPTLLRLGVSESVELRVESDGFARARTQNSSTGATQRERGFSDASLGVKWHTQEGNEAQGTPSMAWLLHADLDSGSAGFRGQGLRPSLRFVAEWELPNEVSVGVMPGVMLDRNAQGGRFASGILAVTVGKAWTPEWRGYVELAGLQLASRRNGGSIVSFDAGVAWLVSPSMQLDASFSRGLNATAPDFQWGIGLSVRY